MLAVTITVALLAACGGGGTGGGYGGNTMVPPVNRPNPTPTASATATPGAMPALTATIKGTAGFASPNGFTLYEFGADTLNVSNCNAGCAAIWPPFMAAAGAQAVGGFTVITRADGSKQWAFNGHALYNFSGDAKAGDANGDGLNLNGGIWHVARP